MQRFGTTFPALEALHAGLIRIAEEAGRVALRDFRAERRTTAEVQWKEGGSPVTSADHAVDAFLAETLPTLAAIGFHSEERPESWTGERGQPAFVVDPIDGTRNFIEGGDAWCIVVGVIAEGMPVAGAVHLPARNETYSGFRGGGAFLNGERLTFLAAGQAPYRTTGPRPIAERLGRALRLELAHASPVPALAHRVLVPLRGGADLAVANPGGHDWDIVASDCILREAGGNLLTLEGTHPVYGLTGAPHPPLVAGSQDLLTKIGVSLLTNPA
ncbi:MAG: 3'(2'),5'-bisphosphate nucleotidase CysQ [Rhizobiales bacterium PAR1]|nr:MAG: 3'(2'),5'-bisphosphate nucleotidase CysQ [Rhizobiales bacterium PAR1]